MKEITSIDQLAIFGHEPMYKEPLYVGRPNIGSQSGFIQRVNDILERRWLTNNGPYVVEFENKICNMIGVRHCVAVCNATIGLEILFRALELTGEVILPSFTFIATAHALRNQNVTPVFCDIDPKTHNIDPEKVVPLITRKTSAILGVHVWGKACEISNLDEIAKLYQVKLLFDAAHAFGCSHHGSMIGTFGDAEVFSFHATKYLNSIEGGAIVTNNDELAEKLRLMRNFGFSGYDNVVHLGTNAKMTEISAAMGITNLEFAHDFISVNFQNYHLYRESLESLPGIRILVYDEKEHNNYHYVIIEIDDSQAGIDRDTLIEILHAENIIARRYFYPGCHRMEPYRSMYPNFDQSLPETDGLVKKVMSLPNGTAITPNDVKTVSSLIGFAIRNAAEIRVKLLEREKKLTFQSNLDRFVFPNPTNIHYQDEVGV